MISRASIHSICFDFDGTIVAYDGDLAFFHPDVVDRLNDLEGRGVRWYANSGRGIKSQLEILDLTRQKGLLHMPAGLICGESFIYDLQEDVYVDREPWNTETRRQLRIFHAEVQRKIASQLDDWMVRYDPQDSYIIEEATVFLVDTEAVRPLELAAEIERCLSDIAHAEVITNGGWVFVLPDSLGKGAVLRACMGGDTDRLSGVLAVGNDYNDISMLDGASAGFVGCPSDAADPVIRVVQHAGGYVAQKPGPAGSIEVVDYYLNQQI